MMTNELTNNAMVQYYTLDEAQEIMIKQMKRKVRRCYRKCRAHVLETVKGLAVIMGAILIPLYAAEGLIWFFENIIPIF